MQDFYGPGKGGDAGINTALPKGTGSGGPPIQMDKLFQNSSNNDNDFSVQGGKKGGGIRQFMSHNAGVVSDAYGAFMGNGSFFDMGERLLKNKPKFIDETLHGSNHAWVRKIGDKAQGLRERVGLTDENIEKGKAIGKEFENLGGFTELYKGFNEIRDTMFVNGAPQDWKSTAQQMDENKKKKDEQKEYNFTHDEGNRQYMIQAMNLEEKAQAKYPNDPTKQTDWIDGKVDSELKKLAQDYLPLGVKDASLAYSLRQDEKQYGYTPIQAYQARAKEVSNDNAFGIFNANINNVNQVNNASQGSYSDVSSAIPNAKEFWDNGYRNVEHMQNAQMIQDKLKTSLDMAMKIEQALRSKGKASYNGSDPEIRKKFDEINNYYKNMKKK